jgi:hypothetical protein
MPYFPIQDDVYRVLERELPPNTYIDGPPTAGYSTADMYATALTIANVYAALQVIYLNEFPQSADEYIDEWEVKEFGSVINASLSLADRQAALLRKIRSMPSITLWQVLTIVVSFLPAGVYAQIVPLGCGQDGSGWILGVSRLSSQTILGWANGLTLNNPNSLDLCTLISGSAVGWRLGSSPLNVGTILTGLNSWQTISTLQKKAYTYEIRIFGYTLTGAALQGMLLAVTAAEPARSTHILRQNLSLAQFALTVPVPDVTQSSGINCITVDPTQMSGYSGLTTPF